MSSRVVVVVRAVASAAVLLACVLASPARSDAQVVVPRPQDSGPRLLRLDTEAGLCEDGIDNDDDKKIDCADLQCRMDRACLEPAHCSDGRDNDLDGLVDCDDTSDCCGAFACRGYPGCPETPCDDGIDNDGDGPVDCADSDCRNASGCKEALHCADGVDNDLDGLVDCIDSFDCCSSLDCFGSLSCPLEDCTDGIDQDGDGLVDCDDPDCIDCSEQTPDCTNGIDDDSDGDVDCADDGCRNDAACDESLNCSDGVDNDLDGLLDCDDLGECCVDPACAGWPPCPELDCTNGLDDDSDGLIDCADFDCRSRPPCREALHCADGIDNDLDGRVDCADAVDCCRSAACAGWPACPESICDDLLDNDGDGFVDCADSSCGDDPLCECTRDFDCAEPMFILHPPTTDCRLVSGTTCEDTAFFDVALVRGRTYTFTLCPATCAGAGAEFDSYFQLYHPDGYTVATNDSACGTQAQIRFPTDPVDGSGLYCLRITNEGGGTRFTMGYSADCVPPTTVTVFPSAGATDDPLCERPQLFDANVDGPGPFDWTWTIASPPGGSATPASGTGRGDTGTFECSSTHRGAGIHRVTFEARNACGSASTTIDFELHDRAGPDASAVAVEAPCRPLFRITGGRSSSRRATSCAPPCTDGVVTATGDWYDVLVRCGDGAFTVRTGPAHPATIAGGAAQDVLYGGAAGKPGTSEIAWRVHDLARTLSLPPGGGACPFDPPDTLAEPNSSGVEQEWTVTLHAGLTLVLREEVVTFGDSAASAGVRVTLGATSAAGSTDDVLLGLRWLLDVRGGPDDGPLLSSVQCDPPSESALRDTEHELLPGEIADLVRVVNDEGSPSVEAFVSTSFVPGFDGTRRPDRLAYVGWVRARDAEWDYEIHEGDPTPDDDAAVLLWMGSTADLGLPLAPGGTVSRSVVLVSDREALACGRSRDGSSSSAVVTICPGDCAEVGVDATDACGPVSVSLAARSPGAPDCPVPPCVLPFPVPGRYDYSWLVTDGAGTETDAKTTVIVRAFDDPECNQPPTCVPAASARAACRDANIDGAAVDDPDGDAILWSWTSSRPEVSVTPASGLLAAGAGSRALPPVFARLDSATPPCGEGATLTLTHDDGHGHVVSCSSDVLFDDDVAPSLLDVPADATVGCDAVPAPAVIRAEDACDGAPALSFAEVVTPGGCAAERTIRRTWTAVDACGNARDATQVIDVVDAMPPRVTEGGVIGCLWPPNHRMACFGRGGFVPDIVDDCGGAITWRLVGCLSDQPDDGLGDGSTDDDCVASTDGDAICVRAERQGLRPEGRRYGVLVVAKDECGNESAPSSIGSLLVPRDQREHPECRRTTGRR